MFTVGQPLPVGQSLYPLREHPVQPFVEQASPVLAEAGVVPYWIVDGRTNESVIQQVADDALDQITSGADYEHNLQQHGLQQAFRWHRRSAGLGVGFICPSSPGLRPPESEVCAVGGFLEFKPLGSRGRTSYFGCLYYSA